MVTIVSFKERQKEDGASFFVLELQGGIDLVMSKQSGQYYATSKRVYLSSTFNEVTCMSLLGTQIPGEITKQECEPYEYTLKETGEVIILTHRWCFIPETSQATASEEKPNPELVIQRDFFGKNPNVGQNYAS